MAVASAEFLKWAEAYDTAGPEQRSLIGHAAWLATLKAPVLRLDLPAPLEYPSPLFSRGSMASGVVVG